MNHHTKIYVYSLAGLLFLSSLIAMLYFGYKTFYIEKVESSQPAYSYHFALVAEETENNYWRLVEKGAKQAAAEKGIYLEYIAPNKADNDQLLKLFDRMIAAKVDGIIVQGIEGERFVDLVHKGVERNIPVITIDTDVPSERKVMSGQIIFMQDNLLADISLKTQKENSMLVLLWAGLKQLTSRSDWQALRMRLKLTRAFKLRRSRNRI